MSVWDEFPDLSPADLRTLVAVTAQVLLEHQSGSEPLPLTLLQRSTAANAREIAEVLHAKGIAAPVEQLQEVLEDDQQASSLCLEVLQQVRSQPVLADWIAAEFELRRQKMCGVELALLAGALVVLAIRIKRVKVDEKGTDIELDPAGDAVKVLLAGLLQGLGGGG